MRKLLHRLFGCRPFEVLQPRRWTIHRYYECSFCGKRTIMPSQVGYQPHDRQWLKGETDDAPHLPAEMRPLRKSEEPIPMGLYPFRCRDLIDAASDDVEEWLARKHAEAGRRPRG